MYRNWFSISSAVIELRIGSSRLASSFGGRRTAMIIPWCVWPDSKHRCASASKSARLCVNRVFRWLIAYSSSPAGAQVIGQFVRNAIALDMRIDLVLVIAVVTQRVENLSQTQMRQMPANIFWRRGLSPQFDYRSDGCPRSPDNWLATQNLIAASDVEMFSCSCHAELLNHKAVGSQRPTLL
jgi:hypothetical protein